MRGRWNDRDGDAEGEIVTLIPGAGAWAGAAAPNKESKNPAEAGAIESGAATSKAGSTAKRWYRMRISC